MPAYLDSRCFRLAVASLCVAAIAWIVGTQPASAAIKAPAQPFGDVTGPINEMRNATKPVIVPGNDAQTKQNRDYLARLAQFLVWRVAQPPYNGEQAVRKDDKVKPKPETETMQYLMDEAERMGVNLTNLDINGGLRPLHYQYANEFGKAMQFEVEYVLDESSKNIERINAVRMLAVAAKLPYAGFADTFMKIIKSDKYSVAYKVYAFQGLRNVLTHSSPDDPNKHILPPEQLVEIALYLEKLILEGQAYTLTGQPGEADSVRVVQFIRRYAIQALGQFKQAVIRDRDKNILAKPGYALIIVAAPAPDPKKMGYSYGERIDALIGFCQMRVDESMNLEAATYWINEALIEITNWESDEQIIVGKVGGRPTIPWKIAAARMIEALNTWKKNMQGVKAAWQPQVVVSYVEKAVPVLERLEKDGLKASVDARELNLWRKNREPKDRTVFREVKKEP